MRLSCFRFPKVRPRSSSRRSQLSVFGFVDKLVSCVCPVLDSPKFGQDLHPVDVDFQVSGFGFCVLNQFRVFVLFAFPKVQSRFSSRRSRLSGFRFWFCVLNQFRVFVLFAFPKVQSRFSSRRSRLSGFRFHVFGFAQNQNHFFQAHGLFVFRKVQLRSSSRRCRLSGFSFSGLLTNEFRARVMFSFRKFQSRFLTCRSRLSGFFLGLPEKTSFRRMSPVLPSLKFSQRSSSRRSISTFGFHVSGFFGFVHKNEFRA